MTNRRFAERLNHELDSIGVPEAHSERVAIFAKLLHIPRYQAQSLLTGIANPNHELLQDMANEFEVNADWLLGTSDKKSAN